MRGPPPPPSGPGGREILLWDDAIHEQQEASLLYFWRLSFGVYYEREYILDHLRTFYAEYEITSYCVYQTLGDFDLLLRLWIPRRFIAEEISTALGEALHGTSLERSDYLSCHTRVHWAKAGTGATDQDSELPLDATVGEDVIASVNEFNRIQFKEKRSIVRPAGTEALISEGLLTAISLDTKGIRMFVMYDRARRAGPDDHQDVLERLMAECLKIEQEWAANHSPDPEAWWPTGPHFSIYSGGGTMTDFLLMIRAPYGYFHEFVAIVIASLRGLGIERTYRIRPYTFVIADELFTDFREHRVSIVGANITTQTLLGRETDTLEFKGSFAVNYRRWRSDDFRDADNHVKDMVVKSVCGFLNSLEGGTLIIGVLETEREYEVAETKGEGHAFLAWLEKVFGYTVERDQKGAASRPFANALIGIEHEYSEGGPYSDAEKYYTALSNVLKDHIDPNPLGWLRLGEREVDGRKYAVVTVRPADTWCYAKVSSAKDPQFFVREGASTRAPVGREAELYRSADPRGLAGGSRARRPV